MAAPMSADALSSAVAEGNTPAVQYLLSQRVQVNVQSSDGFYPLCLAAFWGYSDIVELLLKNGAGINVCNSGTKWTALHCAAFQGHGKVILKLMQHKPDLQMKDAKGRTAADFASALDAIWPFFAAAGCKRTAKSELIRMEIVQKVKDIDPTMPQSDLAHFSRPGSAYVMRSQPLRGQRATDVQMAAAASGDVLMSSGEHRTASRTQPAFNMWRT
ncbi:PREDICTED: ankycorbin-like [Branchiostoma belcheri]|uniref:Ankycorbin-like n=1 Tax=Branchiostoma belcheri TaxID=7741 RepID=A0A6P4ZB22_BRABE|nr:PREDICTED: ankycorbin-like [Branchiostoma belcheri]